MKVPTKSMRKSDITKNGRKVVFIMKEFKNYSISFSERSFEIFINGLKWFSLPVSSSIDTAEKQDTDIDAVNLTVEESDTSVKAVWKTCSNLWFEKVYTVTADESGFYYGINIKGSGTVSKIRYFTSPKKEVEYEAAGYLLPVATHKNRSDCTYKIFEDNEIALGYFAPPPFVYPFFVEDENGWFGLGLVSKPGEYNYDKFIYRNEFRLELPLYNRTVVNGEWQAHGIWGGYGEDAFDVISAYSEWHFTNGLCERHEPYENSPLWWRGPIFCGWGEQQTLSSKTGIWAADFATQTEYEKMYETLKAKRLKPSFIIIDAKWQEDFGTNVVDKKKWPDLRAFTDKLHRDGIKVVLWIRSFNCEGLPHDECVKSLTNPIAFDPTNPKFVKRMTENIRTLLSDREGCFNCDGFKVDFINCIPEGEKIETFENGIYGVELIKRWLELVKTVSKQVKPDALMNVSCAHPYMASVSDEIRIHDYHSQQRAACSVMGYRRDIANAVFNGIPIDCDCGGYLNHRDFERYMKYQPKIGIPDLYWLSATGDILKDDSDFDMIRNEWQAYKENLKKYNH